MDTYHLTNIQGYFTGLCQFPNRKENLQIVKNSPNRVVFYIGLRCVRIQVEVEVLSTPSVHPSFTQNAILLNPKTLSCFNNKGVGASDILKRQEVEMGQLVPGEVEVVAHPSGSSDGYLRVISGFSEGYQRVIRELSVGYQRVISGLSEGYQWVISGL